MKQFFEIFRFDVKRNIKNFMGAYMIIVPVIILIILRSFLPAMENTERTIAVVSEGSNAVEAEMIEYIDETMDVKTYKSIEEMEQKLRGTGSAEGLYWDPVEKQYVSVLEMSKESNKVFSTSAKLIRQRYHRENYPNVPRITTFSSAVPSELSDRTKISPVATMGGSIFLIFMIIVMGFILGLGIVNDKEEGTDKAIRISPVTKVDYFMGKSLQPLLIMAAYTIIAMLVLGLLQVNILQVYVVILISYPVTLLFGLLLGALGKNETETIGLGKMLSMVVMLAILGGTLLPDNWHWVVWWAPFYWAYDIFEEIFTETAGWGGIAWKSAVMVGLTGLYFMLLRKKIIKGLS